MKWRLLLQYFSLACLVLSMTFNVIERFLHNGPSAIATMLLFAGMIGVFSSAALREYENRLTALEKAMAKDE